MSHNSVGDVWWVDSDATQHMTPVKSDVLNYTEFDKHVKVNLADNSFLLAHGTGDVGIELYNGNNKFDVMLKNVLYIPSIENKLFSIPTAVENGGTVILNKDSCVLEMNGKSVKIGHKYGKLYKLNCEPDHSCYIGHVKKSMSLWHQRYGHLNEGDLKLLHEKNMVHGMEIAPDNSVEVGTCHGCALGKSKRNSFPQKSQTKTTQPLQLIHSDVCGPIHIPSVGGSRYFITFIDDYSRHVTVCMLKTKDQV